jgi:hypothetical protein
MCCKDKKEFSPIIMGLCPKPRDLTLYGQKHDGIMFDKNKKIVFFRSDITG